MIVKRDFRGHQISFFSIIVKEMEARGRHGFIQGFFPEQKEIIARGVPKKGSGSQSWLQLNRESNPWEVSFELGFERLLKCVPSGVNCGGLV